MLGRRQYRATAPGFYGTPKEIWQFRYPTSGRNVVARALGFLSDHRKPLGLELDSLEPSLTRAGLGATHVVFAQRIHGQRVRRGWVSVHLDASGQAYLAKNRAVPREFWPPDRDAKLSTTEAKRLAKRALPRGVSVCEQAERMWFPEQDRLEPVIRVQLRRLHPRQWWRVYVHADSGKILHMYDNASSLRRKGRVFDPNPVIELGDHATLLGPSGRPLKPPAQCYREVTLLGLDGSGHLDGKYVSTKLTSRRIRRKNGDFRLLSHERGFDEVMTYYHVDRAIRYLVSLGYKGPRQMFPEPLLVDAHGTREDNAFYDPATKSLVFGTGFIDEAEDGETILHEFGHAIQDAICPEFGQSDQAAAMGEGFGDYFAASFFEDKKPVRYRTSVMSWDGLLFGLDEGSEPPALRRVSGELTFKDYRPRGDEHDNGSIWAAALWDVGERFGRDRADRIIIDSHFQLDPFTTFARGARAILDANQHLFAGEQARALRNLFEKRAIDVDET